MRIKVELTKAGTICLPVNYQYPMSAMIYNNLSNFDSDYAEQLHEQGFKQGRKRFKLFVFSQLFARKRKIVDQMFIAEPPVHFFLSSPDVDFINAFMRGVQRSEIRIAGEDLSINQIEVQSPPDISTPAIIYKMLSPCVASIQTESGTPRYLMPTNIQIIEVLKNNLLSKYRIMFGEDYAGRLHLEFDFEYINKKQRISRLVTLKEGRRDEIKVRGFLCPVTIKAAPTMHKVAWESGLGSMNSQGFGMLGV